MQNTSNNTKHRYKLRHCHTTFSEKLSARNAGLEIVTNTVANATNFSTLATKIVV